MIEFKIYQGSHGSENTNAILFSDEVFYRTVAATVEETVAVPAGARFAIFQADMAKLYVGTGSTPITVPTGDLDSQAVSLNPDVRYVGGVTTIRVISPDAGEVVVTFYG